jgi:hypothetical protein
MQLLFKIDAGSFGQLLLALGLSIGIFCILLALVYSEKDSPYWETFFPRPASSVSEIGIHAGL